MLRREHRFKANLGRIYSFSRGLRCDDNGDFRRPDVQACEAYARQTLDSIARSNDDPFHYRLLDLWLDVYQRPWDQPTDLDELINDLAEKIGAGELKGYIEYDPNEEALRNGGLGAGDASLASTANNDQNEPADAPRTSTGNAHNPSVNSDGQTSIAAQAPTDEADDNPHPGLHNRQWDDVTEENFTTRRAVDMENLSESEKTAARQLRRQGRDEKKVKEVLSSGDNFRTKELHPGDKLYGFDYEANEYPTKNPASPYWLDEAGYKDVKAKFYKDGSWDREGLKNYLALPCSNRADVIDTATVEKPHTVVESDIGKATEEIGYTREDHSTGMMAKIMSGGGTQMAPNPNALSEVNRLEGTP